MKIVSILDEHGLTSGELMQESLQKWGKKEIESFYEGVSDCLDEEKRQKDGEAFDAGIAKFIASSSIRGDSGCIRLDCRRRKLDILARYAALYADQVIVPVLLPDISLIKDRASFSEHLSGSLQIISEFRELVLAGIIKPISNRFYFCAEHGEKAQKCIAQIEDAMSEFVDLKLDKLRLRYYAAGSMLPSPVSVFEAPEDYLDHGTLWTIHSEPPDWAADIGGTQDSDGMIEVSSAQIKKKVFLDRIFGRMASAVTYQQILGIAHDAKCLTDSSGEAEFLSTLKDQNHASLRNRRFAASLAHEIPLFSDLPITTILQIRKNHYEPFVAYRKALDIAIQEYLGSRSDFTESDVRTLYGDVIKPQLLQLQMNEREIRRRDLKRVLAKMAIPASVLTVGAWGGFLPSQLGELFKFAGGVSLITQAADAIASIEKNPAELRNHNLYFLLKLSQASQN